MEDHDFRAAVAYAADVDVVYDAAATPAGPRGWWTTRGDAATHAGQVIRLEWSASDYVAFRIDELERPRCMRWSCVAQHDSKLPEPDEWVGTTLRFDFAATADGTVLAFEHNGLVRELECFEVCRRGWDFFLDRSLRRLVEQGCGMPYRAAG